jgi:protein-S-isoprenylcysteine O-methyltransferase Ste14
VLVTSGVNGRTRNPMYLGLTGLLVAHAIRRGSVWGLVPVGAFIAVLDRVQIPMEEAALEEHFGAEYQAYRARVPRWLDKRSFADAGGQGHWS